MTLEQLIAIDTQNPGANYAAMTRHLRHELEARGARVRMVAGNVLGTWGKPRVMFNAHMDTVRADGWKCNPLKARTHAGRVYGLGACDTKGNIQAILDATQGGAKDLAALLSTDEECGPQTGAARFLKTATGKAIAKGLRGAVVMEPTENRVIARHPGYVQVELTFHGSGGHSSSRKASAAGAAVSALHGLQSHDGWNVNVSAIAAQAAGGNIRASSCTATVSIRSFQRAADVIRRIKTTLPTGTRLSVKQAEGPLDNRRPFVASENKVPYWTDAGTFEAAGVNAVVYGAGSIAQAHKPNEYVSFASLNKAAAFLEEVAGGRRA
ncbi:M20/M25/M40 family metallo-hydrolase [Candidatus Micrarchaeota archaeon]|nr:M20/M25/M40 family metallo-hydrolase [Candidatus Micrarchaeota archaeon]